MLWRRLFPPPWVLMTLQHAHPIHPSIPTHLSLDLDPRDSTTRSRGSQAMLRTGSGSALVRPPSEYALMPEAWRAAVLTCTPCRSKGATLRLTADGMRATRLPTRIPSAVRRRAAPLLILYRAEG